MARHQASVMAEMGNGMEIGSMRVPEDNSRVPSIQLAVAELS
jgi:hypothetical protein